VAQHGHTEHVAAEPDAVFAAISDVRNLQRFVPQMTAARPTEGDHVEIDARRDPHAG
jgi:ribosome-associated toxin RatA of RatAB toxin-antitoxin module